MIRPVSIEQTTAFEEAAAALSDGEWERARAGFQGVLEEEPTPDAEEGLGRSLWWLRNPDEAIVHMERAYAGFRERGNVSRAARAALWLAREYQAVRGNAAASNGWSARAEGLLRDAPTAAEHGWLALTRAERAGDPAEMGRCAQEAHEIAEATGDRDPRGRGARPARVRGARRGRRRLGHGPARRGDGRGHGG